MKSTLRWMSLTALSAGLLAACQTETLPSDSADDASAALQASGREGTALTMKGGTVDRGAMTAFEAAKRTKGNDGSPVLTLPHDEGMDPIGEDAFNSTPGWRLSLTAEKPVFQLGEPVYVRTTMQNISPLPGEVAPLIQPEFQHTEYRVLMPNGVEVPYRPIALYDTLPILQTRTFQPGEAVSEDVKLYAPRGAWQFSQPGEYVISARYVGGGSQPNMESNTLRIRVADVSGTEKIAANELMEGESALLVHWEMGDHLTAGKAELERIVATAPESVHAFYAHFTLGSMEARGFFNGETRREARPSAALPHLEAARQAILKGQVTGLPADVRFHTWNRLASSYQLLGRTGDATRVLNEFISRYQSDAGMSTAVRDARTQLESL